MREPIRWVQTNLRQTDAGLDAAHLAQQLAGMRANVLLLNMGGIVAFYPTAIPFHYASPDLPAGRDLFGDVLREAHARGIRVVGRYDLSKTQKAVFDAHPEWFFRQSNGQPVIYNGLYSTCINGGYYREQAMKILAEGLERYDVDGLFFNMFGNQSSDYSGRPVGLCHCDACRRKYRELYRKEIPDAPDDDYRKFMSSSVREVAAAIGELIHRKRPHAGYFNYLQEYTDGIMSESNTALARPLPLWPYSASDRVNRARNSQPGKMSINLNMQFVDFWWRFATVPREEIALRSWQSLANGGALTLAVNGTLDQQDRQAVETARPIFRWAADHEQYFAGQSSAARVLLLGNASREESYRGLFRLLSEEHVPFAVSDNLDWVGKRDYDLVLTAGRAPAALREYVTGGGKLLIVGAAEPEFEVAPVVRTETDVKGYIRVRDHRAFPSLARYRPADAEWPFHRDQIRWAALADAGAAIDDRTAGVRPYRYAGHGHTRPLPSVSSGKVRSPGSHGISAECTTASVFRPIAGLFRDVLDRLLPQRQLRTDAHPLVEMTMMRQGGANPSAHGQPERAFPDRLFRSDSHGTHPGPGSRDLPEREDGACPARAASPSESRVFRVHCASPPGLRAGRDRVAGRRSSGCRR